MNIYRIQVEFERLICVSANSVMPLFMILSSLTISSTWCLKSDLTLWKRIVKVSSEIVFFTVEKKSFCFRRSYSINASLFTFMTRFLNSPVEQRLSWDFFSAEQSLYLPRPKWFLLLDFKSSSNFFEA